MTGETHRSLSLGALTSSVLLHLGLAAALLWLGLTSASQAPTAGLILDLSRLELVAGGGSGRSQHIGAGQARTEAAPPARMSQPAPAARPAPAPQPSAATPSLSLATARLETAAPAAPGGADGPAEKGTGTGRDSGSFSGTGVSGGGAATAGGGGGFGNGVGPGIGDGVAGLPADYLSALHAAIERHKRYPPQARRRGLEGQVRVRFTVERDGSIKGVEVADSSGHGLLDEAAADTLRRVRSLPPLPERLSSLRLELPMIYRLTR